MITPPLPSQKKKTLAAGGNRSPTGVEERAPQWRQSLKASALLEVSAEDINRMDYFFNEAPMTDPSTHNAIVFALQRVFPRAGKIAVSWSRGKPFARVDRVRFPLGDDIRNWLNCALRGEQVEPGNWWIHFPSSLHKSPIANSRIVESKAKRVTKWKNAS